MITEIVLFSLPEGMTREQVINNFRATAPNWQANPELIRKNYLYDPQGGRGGGVYLWLTREAAARAHDANWIAMAQARYGNTPVIETFETPVLVDNAAGEILEAAGEHAHAERPTETAT